MAGIAAVIGGVIGIAIVGGIGWSMEQAKFQSPVVRLLLYIASFICFQYFFHEMFGTFNDIFHYSWGSFLICMIPLSIPYVLGAWRSDNQDKLIALFKEKEAELTKRETALQSEREKLDQSQKQYNGDIKALEQQISDLNEQIETLIAREKTAKMDEWKREFQKEKGGEKTVDQFLKDKKELEKEVKGLERKLQAFPLIQGVMEKAKDHGKEAGALLDQIQSATEMQVKQVERTKVTTEKLFDIFATSIKSHESTSGHALDLQVDTSATGMKKATELTRQVVASSVAIVKTGVERNEEMVKALAKKKAAIPGQSSSQSLLNSSLFSFKSGEPLPSSSPSASPGQTGDKK